MRKSLWVAAALMILLTLSRYSQLVPAAGSSQYVQVSGRDIVDELGRTITLRGFNLWNNDWGYGPQGPFMSFMPAHMKQIRGWGFNFVKLPIWWTFWLEPDENAPGAYNEDLLSQMQWIIDMAWDEGLYSILSVRVCYDPSDMPYWAGWSTHDYVVYNQVDSGGTHGLERFCNLWRMLVARFDGHPGVIGYNPWMFPYHGQQVADGDERVDRYNDSVSPALISTIREESNKIIFWSPVHSGVNGYVDEEGYQVFETGGYGVYPPHWNHSRVPKAWDDDNVVYMILGYGPSEAVNDPEQGWEYDVHHMEEGLAFGESFQNMYNVPMMTNEGPGLRIHHPEDPDHPTNTRPIRQDRLDMVAQILTLFDDYPQNWAYWLYSGEKNSFGVLEDGVTMEESAIVSLLKRHTATTWEGDLDHNGVIDIRDVSIIASAFDSKPGDLHWNQIADLDRNDTVNILDVAQAARDYGKTA